MSQFLHYYKTLWNRVEPRIPKVLLRPTIGQGMAVAIMFLPILLAVQIVPHTNLESNTIKLAIYLSVGLLGWLGGSSFWIWVVKSKPKKSKKKRR